MTWPAYLALPRAELYQRVDQGLRALASCRVCPRDCDVDRLADQTALCRAGRRARVSSYFAHFGEEDCLRGWNGSGTIFFGWCNLRCVFCQNWETSQEGAGEEVTPQELSKMMLELQARGCHNINWVTPEHVVPQILEALPYAVERGLRLPLVYNTSGYDALDSLAWMDGIVDIYLPDFKYWDEHRAARHLKAKDYPGVARAAVMEMHRQVGPLQLDGDGLARRGLFGWLVAALGRDTYVNVMDQYMPEGSVLRAPDKYPELTRPTLPGDYQAALAAARRAGLQRIDERKPHLRLRRHLVAW